MGAPSSGSWLDRFRGGDGAQAKPYLDGIRALAVVMVFFRHAWGHSGGPRLNLYFIDASAPVAMFSTGVDLFFVLSGFLLARSYLAADFADRPRPSLKRYYVQRILRIGPPYWVTLFLVVFLLTPWLIPRQAIYSAYGAICVLVHVFFGQGVYLPAYGSWTVETPFWTLTSEMIFYLLLPAMIVLFVRRRWLISLPLTLVVSLGWLHGCRYGFSGLVSFLQNHSLYGGFDPLSVRFFLAHTFPSYLFHFAIGITACNLALRRERAWRPSPLFQRLTSERMGVVWLVLVWRGCSTGCVRRGWPFWPTNITSRETSWVPKAPWPFATFSARAFRSPSGTA